MTTSRSPGTDARNNLAVSSCFLISGIVLLVIQILIFQTDRIIYLQGILWTAVFLVGGLWGVIVNFANCCCGDGDERKRSVILANDYGKVPVVEIDKSSIEIV